MSFLRHILVLILTAAFMVGPAAPYAFADPKPVDSGPGSPVVKTGTNSWDINVHNGQIIPYNSFDLAADQAVRFVGMGGDVRVLNRIIQGPASQINGAITQSGGNIHVYFVNPAGVFFGPTAQINVTALQAAGGHMSDADFTAGRDRFTGMRGKVQNDGTITANQVTLAGGQASNTATGAIHAEGGTVVVASGRNVFLGSDGDDHYKAMTGTTDNAGQIFANAVSLVGGKVTNEGQVTAAEGGWIVIAAGHDVFIGRDDSNQGVLLRVEGGAKALDPTATGITNTGSLTAGSSHNPYGTTKITLGAADLYGQAIFNTGAIEARRVALQADNGGSIALGGQIHADTADVTFAGAKAGELRGTSGGTQTLNADTVNITATDAKGDVKLGKGLALRGNTNPELGPPVVSIHQQGTLNTSNLAGLDIGPDRSKTNLQISSVSGSVIADNKDVVAGTDLDMQGRTIQLKGTNDLVVDNLLLNSLTTVSEGNIVATGPGGIDAATNLFFITKPGAKTDPTHDILISAHQGTLNVAGDVVTSNGGGVRIEAKDVVLGSVGSQSGALNSGTVQSSGGVQSHIQIGFTDSNGVQQTNTVTMNAINSFGARANEKDPKVAGGDVIVNATGDVTIRGAVDTMGESNASKTTPDESGGSLTINSGGTLTIGSVQTGGADKPAAGSPERGAISLTATKVIAGGNLSAQSTPAGNADGSRDRSVTVNGELELDTNTVQILGGDVTVTGPMHSGSKTDPNTGIVTPFFTNVTVGSSGQTELGPVVGGIKQLTINSRGGDVISHGDINAPFGVTVDFNTPGTGHWRTGGETISVSSNLMTVNAHDASDTKSTTAAADLDSNIHFVMGVPDPTGAGVPPTFALGQDAAIGQAATAMLFTPGRFGPTLDGSTISLTSTRGGVTLDAAARSALTGADLKVIGTDFAATELGSGPGPDFDVSSLELSIQHAIDVNFSVNASKSIAMNSGTDGGGEGITLESTLRSDSISIAASDGPKGSTKGAIIFGQGAQLLAYDGTGAKRVTLTQDADFSTAAVPDVFGKTADPNVPLDLALESLDGTLTLASATQFAPTTKLTLFGGKALDLGGSPLQFASFSATTNGDLNVTNAITTAPGGTLTLAAGAGDGVGTLTVGSKLTSQAIDLIAGNTSGTGAAKVVIGDGASFSGVSTDAPLTSFTIDQSAGISSLPDFNARFTNRAPNMLLTLVSNAADVTLKDPNAVQGLGLDLLGRIGVNLTGDFALDSLIITGPTTLDGNLTTAGDSVLHGALTLSSAATAGTQQVHAGGALTIDGALTKENAGDIDLAAGRALTVAKVDTAHQGGAISILGHDSVKTGALTTRAQTINDSSGNPISGGNVTVHSSGSIDVASIDASGAGGSNAGAHTDATAGGNAGSVLVQVENPVDPGTTIAVGTVNTSGGAGGNPSTDRTTSSTGGTAGSITLTAPGGVNLRGSLLADGGLNGVLATGTTTPAARPPDRGTAGDVSVNGPLFLGVDTGVTAAGNQIHGNNVLLGGDVLPGSNATGVGIAPANTAISVVAYAVPQAGGAQQPGLQLGGNVTAGKIDLEQRLGTLTASQPTILAGDTIRLAASDGQDGATNGAVDLTPFSFRASDGNLAVGSITLEQDAGFGVAGGSPIPLVQTFNGTLGTRTTPLRYGLISHDNTIELDATHVADLAGTDLTLASNASTPIAVHGDLTTNSLTIGSTTALGTTGGSAHVAGNLVTGSTDPTLFANQALSLAGDLVVDGDASILGSSTFTGTTNQLVRSGGTLLMTGLSNVKSLAGNLTFDSLSKHIAFGDQSQSFGDAGGTLTFTSSLVKRSGDLVLGGQVSSAASDPNGVVIQATTSLDQFPGRAVAIAALNGSVVVNASTAADPNASPGNVSGPGTGSYDIQGDVVAFGDVSLNGRANLSGQSSYTFEALRNATGTGGTLTVGGIQSTTGPVTLHGEGPRATASQSSPSAVKLSGNFAVSQLDVEGTSEITGKTTINGTGDVTFDGPIQGAGDLNLLTKGAVVLGDDVATTGAFAVGGDQGVKFVEDSDLQTIQAASISLGNGAASAPNGLASLSRVGDDTSGDLTLRSTTGDVQMGLGQRMVVNGNLSVISAGAIALADTAALRVNLTSKELKVLNGSTIVANSISSNAKPSAAGGGVTFAVPTGTEVSGNIPSDNVVVRAINTSGTPLTPDDLVAGIFPEVTGAAIFDYARNIPEVLPPAALTRPQADTYALAAALGERPLWAEELLAYLERRSVENPGTTGRPMEAELLPPVGARPGETLKSNDARVRGAAAEDAVALYRQVFRPDMRRDPETGVIDAPSHSAEIRAAFQQPIDTLRRAHRGQEVTGSEVAKLVQSDVKYTDARRYREQLGALLEVGSRALTPEQRPRFQKLLLADITPYGISQPEFSALFE